MLRRSKILHIRLEKDYLTYGRMLYEFHRQQNGKKPGTIHATYLISGTKQKEPEVANDAVEQDGEDTHMQSSPPFMSSSMPQPQETSDDSGVLSITLVREENLDGSYGQLRSGGAVTEKFNRSAVTI